MNYVLKRTSMLRPGDLLIGVRDSMWLDVWMLIGSERVRHDFRGWVTSLCLLCIGRPHSGAPCILEYVAEYDGEMRVIT